MTEEQIEQLDKARQSYSIAKKDRDFRYYQIAFDEFLPLYKEDLLTDGGDLNAFLTCCKWLNVDGTKSYFEKAFKDLEAGKINLRKKDDINHFRRNYINHLIDNIEDFETAETLINDIKSQFDNDFQLYDLEAKLYTKTGRLNQAIEMFDQKSTDWDLHKRQKNDGRNEWLWFHRNFYATFYHFVNDKFLDKKKCYPDVIKRLDELKLALSKIDEIVKRLPVVRNTKGEFVVGNAKNLLIALDKTDESIIPREKVFISYARQDRSKWLQMVKKFLKPLEKDGLIIWTDEKIRVGTDGKKDIEYQLRSVKVGLLVITQHFLNSDFIDKVEIPPLIQASQEGMILIPLICEHCSYLLDDRLKHLDSRPDPKFPLESLNQPEQNKTMTELLFEIKGYLDSEKK